MSAASREDRRYLEKWSKTADFNFVKDYDGRTLQLSNGTSLEAKTVIWPRG